MFYNNLNDNLKKQYGCKVYKLSLSTGCSCPNRDGTIGKKGCIFCDGSGAFTQKGTIKEQIELAKKQLAKKIKGSVKYIAYFQSFTNTYDDPDKLEKLFLEALEPEEIVGISIATRPDCLDDKILSMLERINKIKPLWIELGLQTIHESTAKYIRRGYKLNVYSEAVEILKKSGIIVITHQILGLPFETKEMMVETSKFISDSKSDGIKFHLLHVLRGTDLEKDYNKGLFKTLEMNEYIDILETCIKNISRDVVIHRLTGDGAKKDLIAPLWSANKRVTLNSIHNAFLRDNIEQGSNISQ